MYYKVTIDETGRNSLKEEPQLFNQERRIFKTLEEVKEFIIDHYGKVPKRHSLNTVYIDTTNGTQAIGFLHSFWNKDWSHATKHWFQTDWVCVTEVTEVPVLIN